MRRHFLDRLRRKKASTASNPENNKLENHVWNGDMEQRRPVKSQMASADGPTTGEKCHGRTASKVKRNLISNLISTYRFPTRFPEFPYKDDAESIAETASTSADIADMDPLVAAIYKNTVLNPLCRLPDEILLLIMGHLDDLALFCLRHSSRTFQRLFSSTDFRKYHTGSGRVWMDQKTWYNGEKPGEMLVRDRYCERCEYMHRVKHRDPRFQALIEQRLSCAPCERTHPAALFSAAQRRVGDGSRICIGHEGSFRVCDHVTLSWEDVEKWVTMFGDLEKYGFRTTQGTLCDEPIHKYRCSKKSSYRARPDGLTGGIMLKMTRDQDELEFTVDWRNHTGLKGGTLSSIEVRKVLKTDQIAGARYLVPPLRPGDSATMAAFDPNSCSCVKYHGSDRIPFELYPPRKGSCRASKKGSRSLEAGSCHYTKLWPSHGGVRDFTATRCALRCGDIEFHYSTDVTLNVFGRKDGQVVDPVWYHVVNPESYGLAEDEESRHILWCPRKSCGNYHGNNDINRFRYIKSY